MPAAHRTAKNQAASAARGLMHHETPMLLSAWQDQKPTRRKPLSDIRALQKIVYDEALPLSKVVLQVTGAEKINGDVISTPPQFLHSLRQQVETFSVDQLSDVDELPLAPPQFRSADKNARIGSVKSGKDSFV